MRRAAGGGLYATAIRPRKKCWCKARAPEPLNLVQRNTISIQHRQPVWLCQKEDKACPPCALLYSIPHQKSPARQVLLEEAGLQFVQRFKNSFSCFPDKSISLRFVHQCILFNTTTLQNNPGTLEQPLLLAQCRQLNPLEMGSHLQKENPPSSCV